MELILFVTFLQLATTGLANETATVAETTFRTTTAAMDPCASDPCDGERHYCVKTTGSEYKCCRNAHCKKGCRDPGEIDNADRIPDPRKFDTNETVMYTCKQGYYGGGSIACLESGKWTKVELCKSINIDFPVSATNASSNNHVTEVERGDGSIQLVIIVIVIILIIVLVVFGLFCLWRHFLRDKFYSVPSIQLSNVIDEPQLPPEITDKIEENGIPIRDFAQYVALRHANTKHLFFEEFQEIDKLTFPGVSSIASSENKEKNRYNNITAYDHTRVRLGCHSRQNSYSDYINANFVSGYKKPKAYIATQGPMKNTVEDFWRMIWENKCTVIVMITKLVEKDKPKCDQYWPSTDQLKLKYLLVTLKATEKYANYTLRIFSLRNTKTGRRKSHSGDRCIWQYHYTEWPDHGTPPYDLPLLTFIKRSANEQSANSGPITVHCSAGVGRTGTYIMLHSMMEMAKATGKVNIIGFLKFIRSQRHYLVQTEEQYIFLHDALLTHLTSGETECTGQQLSSYVQSLTRNTQNGNVESATNGHTTEQMRADTMNNHFMKIAQFTARDIDYDFANRTVNQVKNRPGGVLPVFGSRVMLTYRAGKEGSDYINASYMQGYHSSRQFIVTQLPLANTVQDFWQLIWDQNCPSFITIRDNEWVDNIDKYWPKSGDSVPSRSCKVKFSSETEVTLKNPGPMKLTMRKFILEGTDDDYVFEANQLDIANWPSIDEIGPQIIEVFDHIDKVTSAKSDEASYSTVVQDRFGGMSAGQLVCIHSLRDQLANENRIDVFQTAKVAYQMRPRIFNSSDHILFIYKVLLQQINPGTLKMPTPVKIATTPNGENKGTPIAAGGDQKSANTEKEKLLMDIVNEKVSLEKQSENDGDHRTDEAEETPVVESETTHLLDHEALP